MLNAKDFNTIKDNIKDKIGKMYIGKLFTDNTHKDNKNEIVDVYDDKKISLVEKGSSHAHTIFESFEI